MDLTTQVRRAEELAIVAWKEAQEAGLRALDHQIFAFADLPDDGYPGSVVDAMMNNLDRERVDEWLPDDDDPSAVEVEYPDSELGDQWQRELETFDSFSCQQQNQYRREMIDCAAGAGRPAWTVTTLPASAMRTINVVSDEREGRGTYGNDWVGYYAGQS